MSGKIPCLGDRLIVSSLLTQDYVT